MRIPLLGSEGAEQASSNPSRSFHFQTQGSWIPNGRTTPAVAQFLGLCLLLIVMTSCGGSSGSGGGTTTGPAPTVTLAMTPTSIFSGQTVTVTWTSTNASSVVIYLNGSSIQAVQPASGGSVSFVPTAGGNYTLVATGNGQQTTSNQVNVTLAPLTSFDGLGPDPLLAGNSQDVDPNGAVGTKQYVEYVNIQYQAYDKVTNAPVFSSPQPIGTPFANSINNGDLFYCDGHFPLTGPVTGIHLDGVINFDRLAKRWVVMGKSDFAGPAYYLCLAVSNTDDLSDPNLGWYAYQYQLTSPVLGTSAGTLNFPDWAKLGTWTDGYYVTIDLESPPGTGEVELGVAVCVFDRTDILAQTNASPPIVLGPVCTKPAVTRDSSSNTYLGHSIIPADIDGTTAPPAGRPEYMVSIENPSIANNQTTSSLINLWEAQVDWAATPPTLNVTASQLSVDSYTPGCYLYLNTSPSTTNCVREPDHNGQQIVDSVGDRLMPRFPYRNFGTYESYLVSHTVQTGPGALGTTPMAYQTGIRWYELRVDSSSNTPYIYQQNTINPDSNFFRFLPSIAQDKNGNAAVGYSTSSVQADPSINFSYWNLGTSDAVPSEVTILTGLGEQINDAVNGVGAWGTYSSMTVDPFPPSNDCTFWYVNEYFAADSDYNWSTRISNFTIPGCQ